MESLSNYRALLQKVDELVEKVASHHAAKISCRRGCDSCCRHLSVSPVEGVALAVALTALPLEETAKLRAVAEGAAPDGPCPLLIDRECALYAHRPIICRTHGLPILISEGDEKRVDFCPNNFKGVTSFSGDGVVALDRLNTILAAVNKLFMAENLTINLLGKERISIAEAILLEI